MWREEYLTWLHSTPLISSLINQAVYSSGLDFVFNFPESFLVCKFRFSQAENKQRAKIKVFVLPFQACIFKTTTTTTTTKASVFFVALSRIPWPNEESDTKTIPVGRVKSSSATAFRYRTHRSSRVVCLCICSSGNRRRRRRRRKSVEAHDGSIALNRCLSSCRGRAAHLCNHTSIHDLHYQVRH